MRDDLIHSFASQFKVPVPAVRQFASSLAEQCALISNRFEPQGELEAVDLGMVEAVGAEIGAAIMAEFPPPNGDRPMTAIEAGWGGLRPSTTR